MISVIFLFFKGKMGTRHRIKKESTLLKMCILLFKSYFLFQIWFILIL